MTLTPVRGDSRKEGDDVGNKEDTVDNKENTVDNKEDTVDLDPWNLLPSLEQDMERF